LLVAGPENLPTFVKLSQPPAQHGNPANLSQPAPREFDDLYEYYDPNLVPLPQRQQQNPTPQSQRRPPTRSSSGTPSLRRAPRFENRPAAQDPTDLLRVQTLPQTRPSPPKLIPQPPPIPAERASISFDKSGSTTPQSFQKLVQEESYWPQRSTHISRRTHDAILFALEATRKGSGGKTEPLSIDPVEEKARMSDLIGNQLPSGSGSSRPQNGGTRVTPGPVPPIITEPPRGVRTPTEVMRDRRAREARKRAAEEEAARDREREEQLRREQEEYEAGVVEDRNQTYRPQERRQENIPSNFVPAPAAQQRTSANPTQPRPAPAQANPGQSYSQPGLNNPVNPSSSMKRHRNEALENLNIPANPTAKPTIPTSQPQPTAQPAPRSQFPHAFERWETLSSHWEGLTAYWIRRLQENTNELDNKPIDQQLSRQIGDLSAAGANLFHAVVELQRLRASSERKFQRWFFETRTEQERAQEVQAQLQRQLETERDQRNISGPAVEAARAEQLKAEELVREMRRELQISKEEARRAWEELGRREQEERDRTVALRSGEAVMIGGVQVVPMAHGGPSRGNTSSTAARPVTRDGPIEGGPGPGIMGGQQRGPPSRSQTGTTLDSPGAEERQFTHDPESPTSTDPFTEGRAQPSQYGSSPMRPTQPTSSSAAMAARAGTSTSDPRFYTQPTTGTTIPIPSATSGPTPSNPLRPPTSGTEASYVPSNISGGPSDDAAHRYSGAEYNDDDHYDSEADRARERMFAEQYARPLPSQSQPQPERTSQPLASYTSASAAPGTEQSPTAADLEASAAQYGAGSGWEGLTGGPRHRHPTRLSDILEERSGRTSPSRGSYVSGERGGREGEGYSRR
jgi:hypothetical protein